MIAKTKYRKKKIKRKDKEKISKSLELAMKFKNRVAMSDEEAYETQKELTTSDAYYCINKNMLKRFGWEMTGFVAMFVSMSIYSYMTHPNRNGWFYYKRKKLQEDGAFNAKAIASMKKELVESGLIEIKRIGIPSIEWYKINTLKLIEIYLPAEMMQELRNGQSRKITPTECLGKHTTMSQALKKYTEVGRNKRGKMANKLVGEKLSKKTRPISANSNEKASTDAASNDIDTCTKQIKTNAAILNNNTINDNCRISFDLPTSSIEDIGISNNICDRAGAPLSPNNFKNHNFIGIISYWNNLPNVTKHKLDQETKTIESICQMLTALMQGRPIVHTKSLSPRKELKEFFQTQSLHTRFLRKQWTVQEIKDNLRDAVSLRNETGVNTKISLPNLLWNGFASRDRDGNKTAFSWFYYALALDDTPPAFKDAAICLAESIGNEHDKPIAKWAHELYCFHKQSPKDQQDKIIPLLKWYSTHRTDLYMPVVRDMQEYVRKYEQIFETRARKRKYMGNNRLWVDDSSKVVLYDGQGNVIPRTPVRTKLKDTKLYDGSGRLIN